jgi:hypothetical protein
VISTRFFNCGGGYLSAKLGTECFHEHSVHFLFSHDSSHSAGFKQDAVSSLSDIELNHLRKCKH